MININFLLKIIIYINFFLINKKKFNNILYFIKKIKRASNFFLKLNILKLNIINIFKKYLLAFTLKAYTRYSIIKIFKKKKKKINKFIYSYFFRKNIFNFNFNKFIYFLNHYKNISKINLYNKFSLYAFYIKKKYILKKKKKSKNYKYFIFNIYFFNILLYFFLFYLFIYWINNLFRNILNLNKLFLFKFLKFKKNKKIYISKLNIISYRTKKIVNKAFYSWFLKYNKYYLMYNKLNLLKF